MEPQRNMRQLVAVALVRDAVKKEPPKRVNGRGILTAKQRLALWDDFNRMLQNPKKERVENFQKHKKDGHQLAIAV